MRLASDDSLVSAIKEPLFLGDLPLGTYVGITPLCRCHLCHVSALISSCSGKCIMGVAMRMSYYIDIDFRLLGRLWVFVHDDNGSREEGVGVFSLNLADSNMC